MTEAHWKMRLFLTICRTSPAAVTMTCRNFSKVRTQISGRRVLTYPVRFKGGLFMSNVRFGKHPPKNDYRTLRFRDYVTPALPPPPASYDVLAAVFKQLNISDPTKLFPIDGNDTLGDCTIAAVAHAITTYSGLVGKETIMQKAAVVK